MSRPAGTLFLVILLCSCQPAGPTGGTVEPLADHIPGRVERVNDGDSAVVSTEDSDVEVRLMGVNAPEQDECHHQESRGHLAGLIEGELVGLEVISTDQFHRALAYVWLDDLLVNEDLVSGGFAIATTPPEDGDPQGESLLAAEEGAFLAKLGMWSATVCGPAATLPENTIDVGGSVFDPSGPDDEVLDQERVSLTSTETVDVGGWTIRDESSQHRCRLAPDTRIEEIGLIVTSADECWDPGDSPVWNNGGDMILVLDDSGTVLTRHRYAG
ncbi:MAG: thermonuclease family protein [Acidimicrobiia bacterium]